MQRQRIDHRIADQVVRPVGLADEAPPVVEVDRDPRVVVGPVGMVAAAEHVDHRVDLDGVDVPRPLPQRRRHVVARAGADDHHVLERLAARVAVEQVRQHVGRAAELDDRQHPLVPEVVHIDRLVARLVRTW